MPGDAAPRDGAPRRILVTGAGGFAGRHLLPALRAAFPGAVLVAGSRGAEETGADQAVRLDLDAPDSLAEAVEQARPDAVIHLAARADVAGSFRDPMGVWRTNLLGTLALAEAVLRAVPEAPFLHASSGEIYGLGFQAGVPLDEAAAPNPANPYAASKAAADIALGEMALRGLRAVRLRAFTHTGAGQAPDFVVAAFARQVARIEVGRQEPVIRTGALDRWRDFLDVADVCEAYVAALRAGPRAAGGAFNVCSGVPRRVGDILDALVAMTGLTVQVEPAADLMRPTDVARVQGDNARARHDLGWAPRVPWEATLRTVLEDWRGRVAAGEKGT